MYCEQRKVEIIKIIEKDGSINVNALAEYFNISKETIRKDLNDLEKQGMLKRTHGGALLESLGREYPLDLRGSQQIKAKNLICQKAASYIRENDTLFIDNSSTLLYLIQYIPTKINLTILTNSINLLLMAAKIQNHNWLLICLGGIFNSRNMSVYGSTSLKSADEYYPNKTFFSCAGITRNNMVADSSFHEIEIKKLMIGRAQEAFLLADHTKFDKAGQMFLCGFDDVDYLITDDIKHDNCNYLRQSGTHIILAE